MSWEICAGTISREEDPLLGAQRELREETGYSAQRWSRGPSLYPSPGVLDEVMHLFLAEELSLGAAQPEEDEDLEISFFGPPEIERKALRGEIFDMKTLLALALWRQGWPEHPAEDSATNA
jgi:ADP-ribose pyrophosphatase